ncbi:hypothetical protein AZF37_05535 [endosymbiont 'TC1' of Trimyema compressum]|uniref:ribonuclease III n=1 Tax=endosymbiont 'TC1' of Trimyema compressum TaxID=243899 RepID=UPI0007F17CC8|nr:ribonuclease III [endosymbiont 'TC1' of Trimyema compressum]AMP20706.1 hypothetical protein AZF37_05535 [endosymbiont 'TC1' of Trimyema compressum]
MSNYQRSTIECQKYLEEFNIYFQQLDTLEKALTHPTYAYENNLKDSNQRLEFLGDTILGFIVAEYLFQTYTDKNEGDLSKIKGALVSGESLAIVGRDIFLYKYLLMGKGEDKIGGRYKDSVISDAYESLLAAIYLELGYEVVKQFIYRTLMHKIAELLENGMMDFKTILQELVQKEYKKNVEYKILEENGPDHDKSFTAGIFWEDNLVAIGVGKSKKEAERNGAKLAISYFENEKFKKEQ